MVDRTNGRSSACSLIDAPPAGAAGPVRRPGTPARCRAAGCRAASRRPTSVVDGTRAPKAGEYHPSGGSLSPRRAVHVSSSGSDKVACRRPATPVHIRWAWASSSRAVTSGAEVEQQLDLVLPSGGQEIGHDQGAVLGPQPYDALVADGPAWQVPVPVVAAAHTCSPSAPVSSRSTVVAAWRVHRNGPSRTDWSRRRRSTVLWPAVERKYSRHSVRRGSSRSRGRRGCRRRRGGPPPRGRPRARAPRSTGSRAVRRRSGTRSRGRPAPRAQHDHPRIAGNERGRTGGRSPVSGVPVGEPPSSDPTRLGVAVGHHARRPTVRRRPEQHGPRIARRVVEDERASFVAVTLPRRPARTSRIAAAASRIAVMSCPGPHRGRARLPVPRRRRPARARGRTGGSRWRARGSDRLRRCSPPGGDAAGGRRLAPVVALGVPRKRHRRPPAGRRLGDHVVVRRGATAGEGGEVLLVPPDLSDASWLCSNRSPTFGQSSSSRRIHTHETSRTPASIPLVQWTPVRNGFSPTTSAAVGDGLRVALLAGQPPRAASTVRWWCRDSSQTCLTFPVSDSSRGGSGTRSRRWAPCAR